MREILFKAKRMDNGEWVEGHFTMNPNNGNAYITSCVSWGAHPDRVDPETVCQYTGLSDKTGDKIFENDIMVFFNDDGESSNYVVQWYEHGWIICPEEGGSDDLDQFFAKRSIVVGNIHDKEENHAD